MKKMKKWKNLIKEKVCRYLPGDMGEGVFWKKWLTVTEGGGGLKFGIFAVTSFFNGS